MVNSLVAEALMVQSLYDWVTCACCCDFGRISHELKEEARMGVLHHINIVALLAIIFERDHYGLVMEYVSHGALRDFVSKYYVGYSVYLLA